MQWLQEKNIYIEYDCVSGEYCYSENAKKWFGTESISEKQSLWQLMADKKMLDKSVAEELETKMPEVARLDEQEAVSTEILLRDSTGGEVWFRVRMVCLKPEAVVQIVLTDVDTKVKALLEYETILNNVDSLTGLLGHETFMGRVKEMLGDGEDIAGKFAMFYLDIKDFKVVNEVFGTEAGDELLRYVGATMKETFADTDLLCRIGGDRFLAFARGRREVWDAYIARILDRISQYNLPYEIACHIGVYETRAKLLSPVRMKDRAMIAMYAVKGSYTERHAYYMEEIRDKMLSEREITGMMAAALHEKQFVLYYQPQYSHSNGTLLGAEALVRWIHPDKGMISPGDFIPIFEKNGFITKLDLYVFEEVCIFLRECLDKGLPVVAISSNFSRNDIYMQDFVEKLEEIRTRYNVPVKLLLLEITESAVCGNGQYIKDIVRKLHDLGYVVEMDDFGSGYSSLNVLKDIPLDVIKLDMLFMVNDAETKRGGTILSSVVRMAKWLNMPVIAEGVETMEQADFLRSIGCDYIQGYLYSRPIPREQYMELLSESMTGAKLPQLKLLDTIDSGDFWNPESWETLIFNHYVGGAAIFCYNRQDESVEMLRLNQKYLQEMGMNLSEKETIKADFLKTFDDVNRKIYLDMMERGAVTGEEQECETWRTIVSKCCGEERLCIRSVCYMIGRSGDSFLFCVRIRNVTAEKRRLIEVQDDARRFKAVSEHSNIYYWEYNVATHDMHPCFRCMRDLGMPAVLKNYPESAIEMGVFPPEVADDYRAWMKQIDAGKPDHLEEDIPLTVGRVPFRVRYTMEYDDNGRPVKAYGSATLIEEK